MAINLVRKPSETPNINNYDEYRMFRYATGGFNGVVKNYANECDYEISGTNFKVKSGELVIDGVQARIDASGVNITVDTVTGTEYYTVYCEIDLSLIDNQKVEIKSIKSTVNYPAIEKGDDLTQNSTGIARLELYRFQVNNGVISNVQKMVSLISYLNEITTIENANKLQNIDPSNNAVTKFGDYVFSKRKLLWTGNVDMFVINADASNFKNINIGTSLTGKKLYIEVANGFGDILGGYCVKQNGATIVGLSSKIYSGYNSSVSMHYIPQTQLKISGTTLSIRQFCLYTNGDFVLNPFDNEFVKNVYEIIE